MINIKTKTYLSLAFVEKAALTGDEPSDSPLVLSYPKRAFVTLGCHKLC